VTVTENYDELCDVGLQVRGGLLSGTSGDYTSTTYRTQLFYRGSSTRFPARLDSMKAPYCGTYCDPKDGNTWLTPCAVDSDFAYDAAASSIDYYGYYGLRAGKNHDYYLVINSPATDYVLFGQTTKIDQTTGQSYPMEYWGVPYFRGGAPKDHPAVSPAAKVSTSGINLQGKYLYSVADSMELIEYRSRMAFSVRCGDGISHVNFKRLDIKGLRRYAVFRPLTKDFYFEDIPSNYEDIMVYECLDSNGLLLERNEVPEFGYAPGTSYSLIGQNDVATLDDRQTNTYFSYILCEDYKSLNGNQYINTPAYLQLYLVSDEGLPIVMDPIKLDLVFQPQKSYFFLITINSVYISIVVQAKPWSVVTNDISIEDGSEDIVSLTINIADWTQYSNTTDIGEGGGGGGGGTTTTTTGTDITTSDWNTYNTGNSVVD